MINKDDILKALKDGVSIDDISEELAAVLNEAIAEYDEEEEKKAIAEERAIAAQTLVDNFFDFMIDYYGNSTEDINAINDVFEGFDGKALDATLGEAFALTKELLTAKKDVEASNGKDFLCSFDNLFSVLDTIREEEEAKEKEKKCKCKCKKDTNDISIKEADKVIKSFLDLLS